MRLLSLTTTTTDYKNLKNAKKSGLKHNKSFCQLSLTTFDQSDSFLSTRTEQ